MIRCGIDDREEILSYIGKEYGKCLYLYVDLMKYGFDNPNVRLWLQKNAEGRNTALVLQYYTGMHVFSRDGDRIWECGNCGHIVIGPGAPDVCPVCDHPQSYFELRAENY